MKRIRRSVLLTATTLFCCVLTACTSPTSYDVILRGGTIFDGSGDTPFVGDIAIRGDKIAAIGDLGNATASSVINAEGLAVAPGFINMLSWAVEDLIEDGRSLGDIRQGVTLEVFGEGYSWGPLNDAMKADLAARQGDIKYDIEWTTLGDYLDYLVEKGVSPNIASFVGATSVRIHEIGYDDRAATPDELARMQDLVRKAMREGALGVGSSLIYAPANFASTEELTALARAAAEFDGMYISHIRSEAGGFLEAVDEIVSIARDTGVRAEIYHFNT